MSVGTLVDAGNGESLTLVNLPMTIKVRDDFRLNVNAGWLFDTVTDSQPPLHGLLPPSGTFARRGR